VAFFLWFPSPLYTILLPFPPDFLHYGFSLVVLFFSHLMLLFFAFPFKFLQCSKDRSPGFPPPLILSMSPLVSLFFFELYRTIITFFSISAGFFHSRVLFFNFVPQSTLLAQLTTNQAQFLYCSLLSLRIPPPLISPGLLPLKFYWIPSIDQPKSGLPLAPRSYNFFPSLCNRLVFLEEVFSPHQATLQTLLLFCSLFRSLSRFWRHSTDSFSGFLSRLSSFATPRVSLVFLSGWVRSLFSFPSPQSDSLIPHSSSCFLAHFTVGSPRCLFPVPFSAFPPSLSSPRFIFLFSARSESLKYTFL